MVATPLDSDVVTDQHTVHEGPVGSAILVARRDVQRGQLPRLRGILGHDLREHRHVEQPLLLFSQVVVPLWRTMIHAQSASCSCVCVMVKNGGLLHG